MISQLFRHSLFYRRYTVGSWVYFVRQIDGVDTMGLFNIGLWYCRVGREVKNALLTFIAVSENQVQITHEFITQSLLPNVPDTE